MSHRRNEGSFGESPAAERCGIPIDSLPEAQRPQDPHPFAGKLIPAPIAGHAVLRSMSSGL